MEIEETWSILGLLLALWPGFVTPHPEIVPQHKSNCSGSVGRHTGWIKLEKNEMFWNQYWLFWYIDSCADDSTPGRHCVNNERDYARLRSWVRCRTKLENTVHCNSVLQRSPRTWRAVYCGLQVKKFYSESGFSFFKYNNCTPRAVLFVLQVQNLYSESGFFVLKVQKVYSESNFFVLHIQKLYSETGFLSFLKYT